jgi:hypothetical protein
MSLTSFLFLFIRALPKFLWCLEHRCSENRCVRWIFQIHRSREYEFGSSTHWVIFIPGKLIWTRRQQLMQNVISDRDNLIRTEYSWLICSTVYNYGNLSDSYVNKSGLKSQSQSCLVRFVCFLSRSKSPNINNMYEFIWLWSFHQIKHIWIL